MAFLDAVRHLDAGEVVSDRPAEKKSSQPTTRKFNPPPPAKSSDAATAYLELRGIDPHVIGNCVKDGLVYQNDRGGIKNVVFVGKGRNGNARYASMCGISGDFKGEAAGLDKRFAFRLASGPVLEAVHVFEGAIDVLSYATLALDAGREWRDMALRVIGGIPPASSTGEQTRLPPALAQHLANNPGTRRAYLHLDSDEPGFAAADLITRALRARGFDVVVAPPSEGSKDVNQYFMAQRETKAPKAVPKCRERSAPVTHTNKAKRDRPRER
jgi:hypothetical protein